MAIIIYTFLTRYLFMYYYNINLLNYRLLLIDIYVNIGNTRVFGSAF